MYSQIQIEPNAGDMVETPIGASMGAPQQMINQARMPDGVQPENNVYQIIQPKPTQIPIHPDVQLKKLAFYDVLGILLKPTSLVPRDAKPIQEVPFHFTLTPEQAREIAPNRSISNIKNAIEVQLRFCLLETWCDQGDSFPFAVSVKVNNKSCPLPNCPPVNITSYVKLSPTVTNTITVRWCPLYKRCYCIAVYLVKKFTSAQLLQRMKQKGVTPAHYTRALIKGKLTENADYEIATTMLKVSLNCPLGKIKMSIPCRASTCSHLQCFDASIYLQMNERKPTWICPLCDKAAVYDNLVIDGYFQEVLASTLLKRDDTEIELHKDGSWSPHSLRNEVQILDTPIKPVGEVEDISDGIEQITIDDTTVIALSDSDDDFPLSKRRPTAKPNAQAAAPSSTMNGNGSANQRPQKNVLATRVAAGVSASSVARGLLRQNRDNNHVRHASIVNYLKTEVEERRRQESIEEVRDTYPAERLPRRRLYNDCSPCRVLIKKL